MDETLAASRAAANGAGPGVDGQGRGSPDGGVPVPLEGLLLRPRPMWEAVCLFLRKH